MPTKTKPKRPPFVPQHTIEDVNQPSPVRLQRVREMILRSVAEKRAREASEASATAASEAGS